MSDRSNVIIDVKQSYPKSIHLKCLFCCAPRNHH